jgi:putative polymerase
VLALANYKPQMAPWYVLLGFLATFAVLRSLFMGGVEAKYLRDVMLIPIFVVLGMTFDERNLTRFLVALHAVVLAVMLLEAFDVETYTNLFGIQSYYINTRGYSDEDFWNKESELFVSAVRDERFLGFIDLPRLSSVFLEPVSLGNYCIIMLAFTFARFPDLSWRNRLFLGLGSLAMLIGSDSRLATASSIAILAVVVLAPRLPRGSAVFYLPVALLAAFVIVDTAGLRAGMDDFPGRVAYTVDLLRQYDLQDFVGLSDHFLSKSVDSGFAYLVTTQSILGVAAIWLFIALAPAEERADQIRFTHAACLFIALTMLVSYSFVSIKTAALLWFIQGSLQSRQSRQPSVAREANVGAGARSGAR